MKKLVQLVVTKKGKLFKITTFNHRTVIGHTIDDKAGTLKKLESLLGRLQPVKDL